MTAMITEGMRKGDLEDIVLSLVSVDEYASKIDDRAIVIGLYVMYKDAALDLNRFIQKTPYSILDTEVSPAPDKEGYYLVFFEIMNDNTIVDVIANVLNEISGLCNIKGWQFRFRGHDDILEWDANVFSEHFEEVLALEKKKSAIEEIKEHFQESNLSKLHITPNEITMEGLGLKASYEWLNFGKPDERVIREGFDLSSRGVADSRKLQTILGENWIVAKHGRNTVITHMRGGPSLTLTDK